MSFPSYIFCKFKNENNIYITDRMEGAFELPFLEESINKIITSFKPMNNENKKKSNMKIYKNYKAIQRNKIRMIFLIIYLIILEIMNQ